MTTDKQGGAKRRLVRHGGWLAGIAAGVLAVGAGFGLMPAAQAGDVVVYKDPNCGCCGKWIEHMQAAGHQLDVRNRRDLATVKAEMRVPQGARSCHTAVVDGYFIEGHVPADDVDRLLRERPPVLGLAVPGMPVGSPGMEVPGAPPMAYKVFAIGLNGQPSVFAEH